MLYNASRPKLPTYAHQIQMTKYALSMPIHAMPVSKIAKCRCSRSPLMPMHASPFDAGAGAMSFQSSPSSKPLLPPRRHHPHQPVQRDPHHHQRLDAQQADPNAVKQLVLVVVGEGGAEVDVDHFLVVCSVDCKGGGACVSGVQDGRTQDGTGSLQRFQYLPLFFEAASSAGVCWSNPHGAGTRVSLLGFCPFWYLTTTTTVVV